LPTSARQVPPSHLPHKLPIHFTTSLFCSKPHYFIILSNSGEIIQLFQHTNPTSQP
jgi:hypothetical protein